MAFAKVEIFPPGTKTFYCKYSKKKKKRFSIVLSNKLFEIECCFFFFFFFKKTLMFWHETMKVKINYYHSAYTTDLNPVILIKKIIPTPKMTL
jgi:hypothetical protein